MKLFNLALILILNYSFASEKINPMESNEKTKISSFNKVLMKYEKLHQSFFENDLSKIKESSKILLSNIEAIKDDKISKTLNYTKKKLEEIIASEDLEKNQEAMNIVSQGILVVLEKQFPNKNYARYYCPMVNKYWIQYLSKSEKVMNPYASKSMPHCGEKK
ncbi:hypothetical protein N9N67_07410 [Bacteriovoracaceae bacterium]|nr:hypothetical protein [Bacteriovoracaceae bacterium]